MTEKKDTKKDNEDRREFEREDIVMMVQLDDVYGVVENMTKAGMRIVPDSFPERITDVYISFRDKKDKLFELSGNIVWFKGIGDDKYQIGVKFNRLFDKFDKEKLKSKK